MKQITQFFLEVGGPTLSFFENNKIKGVFLIRETSVTIPTYFLKWYLVHTLDTFQSPFLRIFAVTISE